VEHDMSVVMSISDRISVLHRGEILAEGVPEEIRANRAVQAVYLGGGTAA
jgi:branched-chain amino acid transport system ATP-binding protein